MGRFGQAIKRLPALLIKPLLPFEEPGTRARNTGENLNRRFSQFKELERLAAIANFVGILFIHPATLRAAGNQAKANIDRAFSKRVHDVVALFPIKESTMSWSISVHDVVAPDN